MIKIASFSVEEFYARLKAFGSTDLSFATPCLAVHGEMYELLGYGSTVLFRSWSNRTNKRRALYRAQCSPLMPPQGPNAQTNYRLYSQLESIGNDTAREHLGWD